MGMSTLLATLVTVEGSVYVPALCNVAHKHRSS